MLHHVINECYWNRYTHCFESDKAQYFLCELNNKSWCSTSTVTNTSNPDLATLLPKNLLKRKETRTIEEWPPKFHLKRKLVDWWVKFCNKLKITYRKIYLQAIGKTYYPAIPSKSDRWGYCQFGHGQTAISPESLGALQYIPSNNINMFKFRIKQTNMIRTHSNLSSPLQNIQSKANRLQAQIQ